MKIAIMLLPAALALPAAAGEPQPIHEATAAGDVASVLAEIAKGVSVEVTDADGFTALHYSVAADRPDALTALLDRGADINATGKHGVTPLHLAVAAGDTETVALLLARGADPSPHLSSPEFTKTDPLAEKRYPTGPGRRTISSVSGDEVKVPLTCTLQAGDRRVSAVCRDGDTPLHWAVHLGNSAMVSLLLEGGADVNAQAWYGWTPLHEAARKGSSRLVAALLDAGANPSPRMTNAQVGLTPLAVADICGNYEPVRIIKHRGGVE